MSSSSSDHRSGAEEPSEFPLLFFHSRCGAIGHCAPDTLPTRLVQAAFPSLYPRDPKLEPLACSQARLEGFQVSLGSLITDPGVAVLHRFHQHQAKQDRTSEKGVYAEFHVISDVEVFGGLLDRMEGLEIRQLSPQICAVDTRQGISKITPLQFMELQRAAQLSAGFLVPHTSLELESSHSQSRRALQRSMAWLDTCVRIQKGLPAEGEKDGGDPASVSSAATGAGDGSSAVPEVGKKSRRQLKREQRKAEQLRRKQERKTQTAAAPPAESSEEVSIPWDVLDGKLFAGVSGNGDLETWLQWAKEVTKRAEHLGGFVISGLENVFLREERSEALQQIVATLRNPRNRRAEPEEGEGETKNDLKKTETEEFPIPEILAEKRIILSGMGDPISILEGLAAGVDSFEVFYADYLTELGMAASFDFRSLIGKIIGASGEAESKMSDDDSSDGPAEEERSGKLQLRDTSFASDPRPLVSDCVCLACIRHSRGYINHLLNTHEMSGRQLLQLHNLHHMIAFTNSAAALHRRQMSARQGDGPVEDRDVFERFREAFLELQKSSR